MASSTPDAMVQVLNPAGELVGEPPELSPEALRTMYRWMVLGRTFSDRMVALQRQGRMGTFAPLNGQEAAAVGLAAPLQETDWILGSYREYLSYFVKGVPLLAVMETYKGLITDKYPRPARCLPVQVVLASQVHHAVGMAMGMRYEGEPGVAIAVCGDGATSEGDFNEALNYAAVFKAPVVFVVQNNGWAISTPRQRQTAAETIAARGPAFGMPGHLVDGNDLLAVYRVVSEAAERARVGDGPSLIELVTYRLAAHTTADDPTKYRSPEEVETWQARDPIPRFRAYLQTAGVLTDDDIPRIEADVKAEIQAAVETLEALPSPDPSRMFDVVFAQPTPQLQQQRAELLAFLNHSA